jgi:hypothetical protein
VTGYDREKQQQHFAELLEAAQDDLVDAIRQRETLDYKIRVLQGDIVHLAPLAGVKVDDPIITLGLTDAIRYVFGKAKPQPLGPTEVKDALVESGYDVSDYSNVMASIHTIIKRLLKKGEIAISLPKWAANKDRKYVWSGGLPPPPPVPRNMLERIKNEAGDVAEAIRRKQERTKAALRLLELDNQRIKEGKNN